MMDEMALQAVALRKELEMTVLRGKYMHIYM
jgi:hypothetical protein